MVSNPLIVAVGEDMTKHIHQTKTSFMYSLFEKFSLLKFKGSVIALSLRELITTRVVIEVMPVARFHEISVKFAHFVTADPAATKNDGVERSEKSK